VRLDSRRSWRRLAATIACIVPLASAYPRDLSAQSDAANGTLVLLLPVGAETVGIGQAAVAERLGSESVWSNPAGLAREAKREGAIHHSETLAARGDVLTLVMPSKARGTLAISFNLLDFGNQQITDAGGTPIGLVLPRNILFAGTYARSVGKSFSFGATLKELQFRVDCSGQCTNVSTFSASATALDFGGQYDIPGDSTMRLGVAVRNLGSTLRVDGENSDPLPSRVEVGISYKVGAIQKYVSDIGARVAADLLTDKSADHPSGRFGADVTYQNTVHLRGGYILNDADGAKASVGFGLATGRLTFDIARTFGGQSEDAGKTPAYVSLRFGF
jgi:hypothetical protein